MRTFQKATSMILSLFLLFSMAFTALPVLADEVQAEQTAKFTLAEGSTSNFTADTSAGTIVTDGTGEGYIYFDASTANGYGTSWEITGTVTNEDLYPYLSFGVRDLYGETQWFCLYGNIISLQREWDWSQNVYNQDGVYLMDNAAAAYFAWDSADQGGHKLNYKIVVENDVLNAYFGNDLYEMSHAWSFPLTNATFGGFVPGSEYQVGITWVDARALSFSDVQVSASTKYTDDSFHVVEINNAVADPANDTIVTDGVDYAADIYFSADENYTSYARTWRYSGTAVCNEAEFLNLVFGVQDTAGNVQWFGIARDSMIRMRDYNPDDAELRAAVDGTSVIFNEAACQFSWRDTGKDGEQLDYIVTLENDVLKVYFGNPSNAMQLAWNLPLTEEVNGGFASGSAYRLITATSSLCMTTFQNIRVHTEDVVNIPKYTTSYENIGIRDPFILEENGIYYLYGTVNFGRFEVYTSSDLYMWTRENPCFVGYGNFFGNACVFSEVEGKEESFWAPEVYAHNGAYYMLATFTQDTETMNQQGTVMLKADSPLGPFQVWSDGPITPAGHSCLDATLHFENGVPYIIYAHEWQCSCRSYNGTGSVDYIQLSDDLKSTVGSSAEWLSADNLTTWWEELFGTTPSKITDGPFVYTDLNGQKYLLWSTNIYVDGVNTYSQLATKFATVGGSVNLKNDTITLSSNGGGHGMIFTAPDGQETLIMHDSTNHIDLFDVVQGEGSISLTEKTISANYIAGWNLSLREDIGANFYFDLTEKQLAETTVEMTIDGVTYVHYGEQAVQKNGYSVFTANVAAAQMTSPITVSLKFNGVLVQQKTYSVRQYAEYILTDSKNEFLSVTKNLVKAMLNYGAKAQSYFGVHTDNLANADYEETQFAPLPEMDTTIAVSGNLDSISFYGASLLFKSRTDVRFYFSGDVTDLTFTVEGWENPLTPQQKDDLWYVEIGGINPQNLDKNYTLIVTDSQGNTLSVTYGPMYYMVRKYATGADSLKELLLSMYNYHLAARDYLRYNEPDFGTLITEGYETTDKYVVLSANVEALNDLTYDWKNNLVLGVSGETFWQNYAFQIVYGTNAQQNLIKLIDGMGYDGNEVMQEQWYNSEKLEKLFADGGMDIKLIRMDTRAYLLADLGDGYELIGYMMLPEDAPTVFSIYNSGTEILMNDIQVETGKDAAVEAFNGIDLTIDGTPLVLPVDNESWTVEGRLVIDTDTFTWSTADYRMYAGANGWDQAISVFYNYVSNTWHLQDHSNWGNTQIPDEHWWMVSEASGGMYVRFVKNGSLLTVWTSADGVNWTNTLSLSGITENNIYLVSTLTSQLRDVTISNKALLKQQKQSPIYIPADYTNANYAVFEANIKANDAITYDWNSNILVSISGEVWDAYDFQILYGGSSEQNLIKLTGEGASVDGFTIPQEQWINNSALEKIFTDEGMNIKVVRMDTWAYLLADMGSGYTIVGKMVIPADQATKFGVFNHNTAIEISDYSVVVGQDAAIAAINGLDLTLDANGMALPIAGDWTLEGRVVIDVDTFTWFTADYRMYAGSNSWDQAVAVLYAYEANIWKIQNQTTWGSVELPATQSDMLSAVSGGMYVRFVKSGNLLTLWVSSDGINWSSAYSHTAATGNGIWLFATLASQLRDVKLSNQAVFTAEKAAAMVIPADYTGGNYAVLEANIKAIDEIAYDWSSNIMFSLSGEVWDAYDFQIVYGTSSEQNLVKLTGETTTVNGVTIEQEQWVNDPALEKIFTEDGMNIKVIRMNDQACLLADMGSGFVVIGRMFIPAEEETLFSIFNVSTALEISNYSVSIGEAAANAAMEGVIQ